jgi:multidrug efflux pump subunit AcrA (membrane-fusion protein)
MLTLTFTSPAQSKPTLSPGARCLLTAAFLLSGASWLTGCGPADAQGAAPPAAPVSVAPAVQRTISDSEAFSGRLEATEFVELRPRLSGMVEKVHFADGALVTKGQLLFTIDSRPFAAELARAESQQAAMRAKADLAGAELKRARSLSMPR